MENKQLQEEAEEYCLIREIDTNQHIWQKLGYYKTPVSMFIAGATSKYVEQEKIKAIIDEFDTLLKTNEDDFDRGKGCTIIRIKIEDLEQQLKQFN